MMGRPPSSPLFPTTPLSRSADLRLGEPEDLQPRLQQGKANVVELDRVEQLELAVCGAAGSGQRDEALRRTLQQEATIGRDRRSEEHTSELQSRPHLVCRLLL